MPSTLYIAALSQKGGVGKSTLARLVACTYAVAGWRTKIADFNTKQKTSVDWVAQRMADGVTPEIHAEPFASLRQALKQDYDLMIFDGRPDSDTSTLEIAREAHLILVPCGVALDDLKPQCLFAHELRARGILVQKILFVINKAMDSPVAVTDARRYISDAGYAVTKTELPMRTGYQMAQNTGRCLAETPYPSLNERADLLAAEIVDRATQLAGRRT